MLNKETKIALVFARDLNNVIGKNNTIPWRSPHDFQFFKSLTEHGNVIMGRKTWESLPKKPLPLRTNYVISHNPDYDAPGAKVFTSLEAALVDCESNDPDRRVFIIGGKSLYEEGAQYTDLAYISRIGVSTPVDETCVMAPDLEILDTEINIGLFGGDEKHPQATVDMVRFRLNRADSNNN